MLATLYIMLQPSWFSFQYQSVLGSFVLTESVVDLVAIEYKNNMF